MLELGASYRPTPWALPFRLHVQPATEIDLRRRSQEQRFLRDYPETNPSETAGLKLIGSQLKLNLYLMCGLTDFASFAMVFAVSRGLAEGRAAPWYLGLVGAGLSFSAAVGSILGGWLASRFDGRMVFVSGAGAVVLSIAACWFGDFRNAWLLPGYWLLGIGLGLFYPPLIGWLNQGENPHANRRVVSRTLILFCVAWNVGMMCGQLTAGALFAFGQRWVYGAALLGALPNLVTSVRSGVSGQAICPNLAPQNSPREQGIGTGRCV